ncbi:MAG: preprotein translocase subunit SecG [Ardenticatenaceae bacterium]|nr:preprotein translocase subunit SecG [Ardenticatenaceae bacterium]MCB8949878.1 preprotein translocase subunit SecG [Ardenticatenaceae bacterium]
MNLQPLAPYFGFAEIILAIALTVLVLLQTKGSDLGGFFGGSGDSSGSFRTRRGVEATMHKVTIACAVLFFICTVFSFLAWGQAV